MAEDLGARTRYRDVVCCPEAAELVAHLAEVAHEVLPGRFSQVAAEGRAEHRDHHRQLLVAVDEWAAALAAGEDVPEDVAVGAEARKQCRVRGIEGEHVVAAGVNGRRDLLEAVEHVLDGRVKLNGHTRRGDRRYVGEVVQVLAFGVVEAQGTGDRLEHLHARVDGPALLEPGVPGHADAGELRKLFATQTGGAAAQAGRQADVGRRQPGAAAAARRYW
jgi:hypothetical protein